jgi:hypothetical protein
MGCFQRVHAGVFVLAFVVEFEVGYNPFMHKTQSQKLLFIVFLAFLVGPTHKTPPPPQKQTPSWCFLDHKICDAIGCNS